MTDPNTPLDIGCGDTGCVVARSGGMSTNGGCGCVPRVGRPMTPEVRADLRRILTVRREQVDGLVARIAALEAACLDLRRALDSAEEMARRDAEGIAVLESTLAAERAHSADLRAREQHGVLNLRAMADECAKAVAAAEQRVRAEERERCARVCEDISHEAPNAAACHAVNRCRMAIRSGREP